MIWYYYYDNVYKNTKLKLIFILLINNYNYNYNYNKGWLYDKGNHNRMIKEKIKNICKYIKLMIVLMKLVNIK